MLVKRASADDIISVEAHVVDPVRMALSAKERERERRRERERERERERRREREREKDREIIYMCVCACVRCGEIQVKCVFLFCLWDKKKNRVLFFFPRTASVRHKAPSAARQTLMDVSWELVYSKPSPPHLTHVMLQCVRVRQGCGGERKREREKKKEQKIKKRREHDEREPRRRV